MKEDKRVRNTCAGCCNFTQGRGAFPAGRRPRHERRTARQIRSSISEICCSGEDSSEELEKKWTEYEESLPPRRDRRLACPLARPGDPPVPTRWPGEPLGPTG